MKIIFPYKTFSPREERINILTHGIGLVMSLVALILLVQKSFLYNSELLVPFMAYGLSLTLVYFCSTLTHSSTSHANRNIYNLLDYITIDLLIAGTYTPILLYQVENEKGYFIFVVAWIMAASGIIMKVLLLKRAVIFSIVNYIAMSFLWVLVSDVLAAELPPNSIRLLIIGFCWYLVGLVFFLFDNIPYNHGIFHTMIVIGSTYHFWEIYTFDY